MIHQNIVRNRAYQLTKNVTGQTKYFHQNATLSRRHMSRPYKRVFIVSDQYKLSSKGMLRMPIARQRRQTKGRC